MSTRASFIHAKGSAEAIAAHQRGETVRFMGENDEIAKALDEGYHAGIAKGRAFETGYLLKMLKQELEVQNQTQRTRRNAEVIASSVLGLEISITILTHRLIELEARNGKA